MTYPTNRLSHTIYCVAPDEFDACRSFWREALGVELEDVVLPDEAGLKVAFSLEHGIEILTPTGTHAPTDFTDFLERHGNGLYAVVYNVEDLAAAVEQAEAAGATVVVRFVDTGVPPWSETYAVLEEAALAPERGMRIVLAQIELR